MWQPPQAGQQPDFRQRAESARGQPRAPGEARCRGPRGHPNRAGPELPPPLNRQAPEDQEAGSSGVILEEILKARAIKGCGGAGAVSNLIEI